MAHQNGSNGRRSRGRLDLIVAAFVLGSALFFALALPLALTLIVPRVWSHFGGTKQKVAYTHAVTLSQNLRIYLVDNNLSRPREDMDLTVLTQGDAPLLDPTALLDPWGRPYDLIIPGQGQADFNIVSYGEDGEPGGQGNNADIIY